MSKALLIFSGGLDSTVLLYEICEKNSEVVAVNFSYGSKHNSKEGFAAKEICGVCSNVKLITMDVSNVFTSMKSSLLLNGDTIPEGHYQAENMRSTVVPFRNGILLSIAAGIAESLDIPIVYYGAHSGDHYIYPDCRPDFISVMSLAVQFGTEQKVEVQAPFYSLSKSEIVKKGITLCVPFEKTWTCYNGRKLHCGVCGACQERKEAFELAAFQDPTIYE